MRDDSKLRDLGALVVAVIGMLAVIAACVIIGGPALAGAIQLPLALAPKMEIHPVYIYLSGPTLLALALLSPAPLAPNKAGRGWEWARFAANLAQSICWAVGIGIFWALLVGGFLYFRYDPTQFEGPRFVQGLHLSIGPELATIIGALIGAPLALRAFWKWGPFYVSRGRLRLLHNLGIPAKTGPYSSAPPAKRTSVIEKSVRPHRTLRSFRVSFALNWRPRGHNWVGITVGAGTFAGIAAGEDGGMSLMQIALAVVAALVAGCIAAIQWRASSKSRNQP